MNITRSSALTSTSLQLAQLAKTTENQTIDLVKWTVTSTIAHSEVWLKGPVDSLCISSI